MSGQPRSITGMHNFRQALASMHPGISFTDRARLLTFPLRAMAWRDLTERFR